MAQADSAPGFSGGGVRSINGMRRDVKRLLGPAQELDDMGFRVVPTLIEDKVPALWEVGEDAGWKRWQTEPTGPYLERWFGSANARIGLGTLTGTPGGWVCLDVDSPAAYDWWLRTLGAKDLVRTAHVRTQGWRTKGQGGVGHYWFRLPEGESVRSRSHNKEDGAAGIRWDIKGTGGYATLPPTPGYTWIRPPSMARWAPSGLHKAKDGQKEANDGTTDPVRPRGSVKLYALNALGSECRELAGMADGSGRNNRLNRASFKLARFVREGQIGAEMVIGDLLGAALDCGLDEEESRKTIASGLIAGIRSMGRGVIEEAQ